MSTKIRVVLIDDNPSIRTLLRLLLSATSDLELLDATTDIAQLPRLCAEISPHILLIGGGGKILINDVLLILRKLSPQTRIIVLFTSTDASHLQEFLSTPIHGSCLTAEIDETLIHILRAVAGGATSFSSGVLKTQLTTHIECAIGCIDEALSYSERNVLALLVRGLENSAIAAELHMAKSTVRNYVHSLYRKVGVTSRVDLVLWFYRKTLTITEK